MGMARLLAKAWVLVCLYAGGTALVTRLSGGADPVQIVPAVVLCVLSFVAMGLVFTGGFGASSGRMPHPAKFKPRHLLPNFNEVAFLGFVALSFIDQAVFAPANLDGPVITGLKAAIGFAIPGQHALAAALAVCAPNHGQVFASAFTWLLAAIFLSSSVSRLKLAAGIIRLERMRRPEAMGPIALASALGVVAILGIQLLVIGSAYRFVPCGYYTGIAGALLIGLAPLMLAYLILASLANLLAAGPE